MLNSMYVQRFSDTALADYTDEQSGIRILMQTRHKKPSESKNSRRKKYRSTTPRNGQRSASVMLLGVSKLRGGKTKTSAVLKRRGKDNG
jgi:hypothetical protein